MPAQRASRLAKRIIIACDGTWVNSDNGFVRKSWLPWKASEGVLAVPSNVTRLCRALLPRSDDGTQQIVYYQGGLGSQNSFWSYLFGGFLGDGISENIREAYAFICNNYEEGDEIVLTGFSRGAFTARSIGGLISAIGLLTKHGLGSFYPIFKDWENQAVPNYTPEPGIQTKSCPVAGRPSFKSNKGQDYFTWLVNRGLTRQTIPPIKAIGVWDTVGSLGIPTIRSAIFGIQLWKGSTSEYSFVNTEVAANVEHAYQALALDECRTPFSPTVWESPAPGSTPVLLKELKQTWFPGVHTSVGGGYHDTSISDITLSWMITQLSKHVSFDEKYVPAQRVQNEEFYKDHRTPPRPWAMGLIQRSDGGFLNTLTGRSVRTPGRYHATDPNTGKTLPRELVDTCEFVHPSVRYRIEQRGKGLASDDKDFVGKGVYEPAALKGWKFVPQGEGGSVDAKGWEDHGRWEIVGKNGKKTFIVEEKIEDGTAEMELLGGWPDVEEQLVAMKAKL